MALAPDHTPIGPARTAHGSRVPNFGKAPCPVFSPQTSGPAMREARARGTARAVKADVPPAEAEDDARAGAARPGSCSPSRTTVLLATSLIVLILLALQPGSVSKGMQPVAHMAMSDGSPPDGRCLITRWDALWRVHKDGTRSFIQFPTPGCIALAKTVNDLTPFPQSRTKVLGKEASAAACTLSCAHAVEHEPPIEGASAAQDDLKRTLTPVEGASAPVATAFSNPHPHPNAKALPSPIATFDLTLP